MHVRISVGESFPVAARVIADNIILCEVFLRFDELVLEETTGNSNPSTFVGPHVEREVLWELRGKRAAAETTIRLDASGDGLPQLSEFTVEVIP